MRMGVVEKFLKLYEGKATYAVYRWALGEYFKALNVDSEQYFTTQRNYEDDVNNFLVSLNGKPPKTVRLMISVVKGFLIENGVELPERFWRRLHKRIQGSRALTIDRVPSNEELRRIISHSPIHGKALFLTLASSGMRIGEALALDKDEDIDLSKTPAEVYIRGNHSKTGNPRVTFISREAKEAIEEWLKTRDAYLQQAAAKSKERPHYKAKFLGKKLDDSRLFPFEISTAYCIWESAVRKAGFLKRDKQTNRNVMHIHVLRKFFRSKMATLVSVDVVEALMGHEGYLTEVYRRYSREDLAKEYLKGESSILVYGQGDIAAFKEETQRIVSTFESKLAAENARLEKEIASLREENAKLADDVSSMKAYFDFLQRHMGLNEILARVKTKEDVDELLGLLRAKQEVEAYQREQESQAEILEQIKREDDERKAKEQQGKK